MRLFNHLIPWRTDMPDQPDDIARLRKSHYALDELPETVSFPKHPSEPAREPLPVMEATVDDIAFAIVAATGDIYSGLWYPIVIAAMTLVIGLLFVKETRGTDIHK